MPKSTSTMRPSGARMMFAGLMSLCTTGGFCPNHYFAASTMLQSIFQGRLSLWGTEATEQFRNPTRWSRVCTISAVVKSMDCDGYSSEYRNADGKRDGAASVRLGANSSTMTRRPPGFNTSECFISHPAAWTNLNNSAL
jgi:hypothetical protein